MQDAALTHPNPICQQANALFAMGIAHAIKFSCDAKELYRSIRQWADEKNVEPALLDTINKAADGRPADYVHQQGWVLIAFRNVLWQLLHASNLEEAVVDTVMRCGDTDTNAAICGALLGAVWVGTRFPPNGPTACLTAALRPDRRMCPVPALNASGRWMPWSWLKGL